MLKLSTMLPIGLLVFSSASFAQFVGPGSEPIELNVAEVSELVGDDTIMLKGNIIQQTSDDDYIFQDSSGAMAIEIAKEKFADITVTPEDEVLIIAEADVDVFEVTVEAEELQLVSK